MKKIVITVISIIMILTITGCGCEKKNEEENTNKKPTEVNLNDQEVNGLKVSGINIAYKNGVSKLVANIENTTNKTIKLQILEIKLLDKDKKVIVETAGYIGNEIKSKENKQIITDIASDVRNTKTITITVK